jgi:CubicO group peptidase (beta-lactamase class C family)
MPALRRFAAPALLATLLLGAAACGGDDGGSDDAAADGTVATTTGTDTETSTTETSTTGPADGEVVFPGAAWATAEPADHGLSQEGLDELAAYLDSTNSNCMAVVKDGVLVDERYWNDTDAATQQEIFSASKSYSAALIGIAADLGFLDIDQPASDFITEWQGTDSETVTIRNLLSNDSGRFWDFETDYLRMVAAENRTEFAIGLDQQHPPGEHWEYNNSAIQTLQAVLERSTEQDMTAFAEEHLFGPLGMSSYFLPDASGTEPTFMGVQSGCGDMARFGHLFLNDGTWAGEQIVSPEFASEATSPSQDLNRAYGFLFWINEEGYLTQGGAGQERTIGEGLFWPNTPEDAYAALGLGDQIILVLPSENMVVVRAGPSKTEDGGPPPNTSVDEIGRLAAAAVEGD